MLIVVLFASLFVQATPRAGHAESLIDIYELALSNDPGIMTAEVQTLIGEREFRDALFSYFPRLQGRLDYERRNQNIIESDNSVFSLGRAKYPIKQALVEFKQPILDYGRLMRIRKGHALEARSFAEFAYNRQLLILKVCDGYFRSLADLKRIDLVRAAKRAIEEQLHFVRERSAAGQVPNSEVKEIEAQADLALSELVDAQNAYRDRLESLTELTGSPVASLVRIGSGFPLEPPHPFDVDSWVNMAGTGNNQLQAQQLAIEAAEFRRGEVAGEYLPNLEATGTYDYTDQAGSQFGGGSVTSDLSFGMRLNVPIFNAEGEGYTFIKENYQVKVEMLKLEQMRRKVSREIRDFFNQATGAARKHEALTRAVEATRVRLAELTQKNHAGQVSSVDVLEAQRDLVRAQRDQFDALVEYVLNMTRLKAHVGMLSEEDLIYLNRFLG